MFQKLYPLTVTVLIIAIFVAIGWKSKDYIISADITGRIQAIFSRSTTTEATTTVATTSNSLKGKNRLYSDAAAK